MKESGKLAIMAGVSALALLLMRGKNKLTSKPRIHPKKRTYDTDDVVDDPEQAEAVGAVGGNYTLNRIKTYFDTYDIKEVVVDLADRNAQRHPYVMCGDVYGGRGFYTSVNNLDYIRKYCEQNHIPYEQGWFGVSDRGYMKIDWVDGERVVTTR